MENRIQSLSVGSAGERQTPRDEFGAMLGRGISRSSSALLGVAAAIAPGGAVISAAINETTSRSAAYAGGGTGPVGGGGSTTSGYTAGGAAPASEGLESQAELMRQNQQWTEQYLKLQMDMQQESRQFTAVSNVLKVRHESAKTAINNVR